MNKLASKILDSEKVYNVFWFETKRKTEKTKNKLLLLIIVGNNKIDVENKGSGVPV